MSNQGTLVTPGPAVEFKPWPKTPHWFRDITVTEKLDGTNGGIHITQDSTKNGDDPDNAEFLISGGEGWWIAAQSRKRIITPADDNHGFARWVYENRFRLVEDLGAGTHFGEWWGQGIQRNYGLDHKRFSLFNTKKWFAEEFSTPNLDVVPVLYEGPLEGFDVEDQLDDLREFGSFAVEGFMNPEGVVIYHQHANQVFKIRLEDRPVVDPPQVASIHDLFDWGRPAIFGNMLNLFRGDKAA